MKKSTKIKLRVAVLAAMVTLAPALHIVLSNHADVALSISYEGFYIKGDGKFYDARFYECRDGFIYDKINKRFHGKKMVKIPCGKR